MGRMTALQEPNMDLSTLQITFEGYNEVPEGFESISYDQAQYRFIARDITVE